MNKFIITLVVLVCAASHVLADDVLDLNEENFDDTIKAHPLALVEFFAPWCGHCKSLAPEYSKAATELKGKDRGVLVKVDCIKEDDLCKRFDVRGFPTIKLFRGDPTKPVMDYDSARTADAIVRFMNKQSTPAVTLLKEASEVYSFYNTDAVTVVAFLRTEEQLQLFTAAANSVRNDFPFGAVMNLPEVEAALSVTAPSVLVHRNFDAGNPVKFTEAFDASVQEKLIKFIRVHSLPAFGTIGPENYKQYLERGFSLFWVFHNPSDSAQDALLQDVIKPVASEFYDRLSFVKLDGQRWAEHAKSLGLTGATPGIVIQDHAQHKNFVFDESKEVTIDNIREHVTGFLAGTLSPTVRSQPIPEKNDGPVKVVVGKTFKDIVFDEKKNVLIEFYAPWCGHCTALAPKYEELGKLFADNPNVVIAKIDATTNDSPGGPDVKGFPTLMLYPAGADNKKNPVPLSLTQGMTANDMAKFVRENSVTPPAAATTAHEEL